MKRTIILLCIIITAHSLYASIIEELDNPPEGAHQGQMLLGAFFTIGYPMGNAIDAENSFVNYSSYSFSTIATTKEFDIDHITFSYGVFFEYMPIDYLGAYIRLRRSQFVQRTAFGSDYDNTSRMLFSDVSLCVGPSVHFTNRKWWDISLTPMIGYSFGKYKPTPVAEALFAEMLLSYSGTSEKSANGLIVGCELRVTAYFNGGFFISAGFDWTLNMATISGALNDPLTGLPLKNPQISNWYYTMGSRMQMHSLNFILTVGYAFSN